MVSGIFRLNCPVAHGRNEGWGHEELTIMRNPDGAAQWRASDKHVIYSCLLSPPSFIESPEMRCQLRSGLRCVVAGSVHWILIRTFSAENSCLVETRLMTVEFASWKK